MLPPPLGTESPRLYAYSIDNAAAVVAAVVGAVVVVAAAAAVVAVVVAVVSAVKAVVEMVVGMETAGDSGDTEDGDDDYIGPQTSLDGAFGCVWGGGQTGFRLCGGKGPEPSAWVQAHGGKGPTLRLGGVGLRGPGVGVERTEVKLGIEPPGVGWGCPQILFPALAAAGYLACGAPVSVFPAAFTLC
jgi:hypothetical protein